MDNMGDIFPNFFRFLLSVISVSFLIVVLAIGLGTIMRHFVRPTYNKIWKYKEEKKTSLRNLFSEGLLLGIVMLWFPLVIFLFFASLYFTINSIGDGNVLASVFGVLLSLFFALKIWFMFEHKEYAKKRWESKKSKKKSKKKIKKKRKK